MGNSVTKKADKTLLESLKTCQDFSSFADTMNAVLSKRKNFSFNPDFDNEDEEVCFLFQRQMEFFLYFAVCKVEGLQGPEPGAKLDKSSALQVDFLIGLLQKVLNFLGRKKIRKLEDILWKTYEMGVIRGFLFVIFFWGDDG